MKSTIKKIATINTNKEETIKSLRVDRQIVEMHLKRLTELFKTDTPEQIGQKLQNIIMRDNLFNVIMEEVVRNFEVTYDPEEVKTIAQRLTSQFPGKKEDVITEIAKKVITKSLVFQELAKEWNISISDQEVDDSLQQYYKFSNQSIRPYKEDKAKFEEIRNVMLEEKIVNELLHRFSKIRLDHESIKKQFEEAARRQKEAEANKTKTDQSTVETNKPTKEDNKK